MENSALAELQKENDDLRQLVIRLGTIILRNAIEQRELISTRSSELAPRLLAAMTPVCVIGRLREISLRCSQLSRDSGDGDAARALEDLGVALANEAQALETILRIPDAEE
jgi:hypothetical protein